jgi:hypothetical protein
MAVVPLTQSAQDYAASPRTEECEATNWTSIVAAGAIVAGGLLLLAGWRRTGMVTATAGTVLTLLDQEDTIRSWWTVVPGYIESIQRVLDQVEGTVEEIDAKRETLRQILSRLTPAGQSFSES